jgi:hypothetical protein
MPVVESMVIDYSKSVTEVYQYLAKYIINRDRNLDILCILLTHRDPGSVDLPTWVPDWRVSTSHTPLLSCWDFFASKFAASGFTKAEIQDQANLGKITVKGLIIDQVGQLLDFTTNIPRGADVPFTQMVPFDKRAHLRRLSQTTAMQTCLVPRSAKSDDLLLILYGSKLPMVLRPVQSELDVEPDIPQFEVVGPCWSPQYMFGSVMKMFGDDPEAEWFTMHLI